MKPGSNVFLWGLMAWKVDRSQQGGKSSGSPNPLLYQDWPAHASDGLLCLSREPMGGEPKCGSHSGLSSLTVQPLPLNRSVQSEHTCGTINSLGVGNCQPMPDDITRGRCLMTSLSRVTVASMDRPEKGGAQRTWGWAEIKMGVGLRLGLGCQLGSMKLGL